VFKTPTESSPTLGTIHSLCHAGQLVIDNADGAETNAAVRGGINQEGKDHQRDVNHSHCLVCGVGGIYGGGLVMCSRQHESEQPSHKHEHKQPSVRCLTLTVAPSGDVGCLETTVSSVTVSKENRDSSRVV